MDDEPKRKRVTFNLSDANYNTHKADDLPCHHCGEEIPEQFTYETVTGEDRKTPLLDRSNRVDCEYVIKGKYFTNREGEREQRTCLVTYHAQCYKDLLSELF